MPDVIVFNKLKVTQTAVADADSELADRERVFKLTEIDCDPPPGATAEYVKPTELVPMILDRFLQDEERRRLESIAFAANPAALARSDAVGLILAQLGITKLDVGYATETDDYRNHRKTVPCFRVTLYLRGLYDVFEIRVTANEALTVRGTSFPKGDEIATFRVSVPRKFRIEARYRWNPECCPLRPEKVPEDFIGGWIPTEYGLDFGTEWKLDNWLSPKWEMRLRLERSW